MISCDILIIGGGPAGSTCAWKLADSGLDVLLIDKAAFPRDKVCAGWITPQVVESLELDLAEYAQERVLQSIDGFQVSLFGQSGINVSFGQTVSYGIRRCEFDNYLLQRSGVRRLLGTPVRTIERTTQGWHLNGEIETRMLIGAGGQHCPVARLLREPQPEQPPLVTAMEAEFIAPSCPAQDPQSTSHPYLCFREDLTGYGWCFQKGSYYNIGVGLVDSRKTAAEVDRFVEVLRRDQIFLSEIPVRFRGHSYFLYDECRSSLVDDNVLLVGDAAGLAYPHSGEGIRPAVESGLLAADAILQACGDYSRSRLEGYKDRLIMQLGSSTANQQTRMLGWLGKRLSGLLVRRLMRWPRFVRDTVIGHNFLRRDEPALFLENRPL